MHYRFCLLNLDADTNAFPCITENKKIFYPLYLVGEVLMESRKQGDFQKQFQSNATELYEELRTNKMLSKSPVCSSQ